MVGQNLEWRLRAVVQVKEEILTNHRRADPWHCDTFHSKGSRLKTKNSTTVGTVIVTHWVNIL